MKQENTPPVPQTYEEFHGCMEFLRKKNEQEEEFNDIISKISYDGYAFIQDVENPRGCRRHFVFRI